jgi:hypothetical protein
MMYAKLSEDRLTINSVGPLPKSFGNISGFNKISEDQLLTFGFVPVEDSEYPNYDSLTQRLVAKPLTLSKDGKKAIRSWSIESVSIINEVSIQEQLNALTESLNGKVFTKNEISEIKKGNIIKTSDK